MTLKIGDKAPAFVSKDEKGNEINLEKYIGQKVILYFYPKDNTSGCTAQACDLRDNYADLQQKGYVVLGVSSDNEKSHQKFIDKFELPFTLVADVDKSVHELYGVWQEKSMYGKKYMGTARTTFVIDEKGMIINIIEKVKTATHTTQILG
ncbi:MAG: thioredoxin-dependent thiol peroxidase [Bacteroidetes bacterium]|nr:MAG: thioredoxin-dependent thiol peroxidase [Bacteroidota bacterium]TAG89392.1 MAG: thioredoxin-dependent thiol peroxidase [Bacteroidota bacterium]